ncbi:unnamed protein product [Heligmosomoides polygyrus]|uniref:Uncharacterized protein n=1 Tax=Heligmosomoides polygyrus TaxID=6339 RepID=A0A3P8DDT3_HELPZ|nr:unnamed protein product [Heligmosomoides polygyrus]
MLARPSSTLRVALDTYHPPVYYRYKVAVSQTVDQLSDIHEDNFAANNYARHICFDLGKITTFPCNTTTLLQTLRTETTIKQLSIDITMSTKTEKESPHKDNLPRDEMDIIPQQQQDGKTFEEFLEEYSELTQRFQIPRKVTKSFLPLFLTGTARLKYLAIEERDNLPWEELVTTLATKLKNKATLIGEFARKVHTKTKYAFQGLGDKVVNHMDIDFFIKGLNPKVRKAIRRLPDMDDFESVVNRAEKEHRILQQEWKEENDSIQVVNAMLRDEKNMRITESRRGQQFNGNRRGNFNHRRTPTNRAPNPVRFERFSVPQRSQMMARSSRYPVGNRPFWNRFRPRPSFSQPYQPPYWQKPHQNAQPSYFSARPGPSFRPGALVNSISAGTHLLCICGNNIYANRFLLPPRVACSITSETPMIIAQAQLYMEQIPPVRMNATKCYRDSLAISVTTYIFITTSRTILGPRRMPIPRELCEEALKTNKINDHELITISPGIRTSEEIEDGSTGTAFWGTNTYLRSVFTLEEGEVASFDGESIISSIQNTENCTLTDGYCITEEYVFIWKPLLLSPRCRYTPLEIYDTLVTPQYAVIPALDVAFEFSFDQMLQKSLTAHCHMEHANFTTSHHILTFPSLPDDTSLEEFIDNISGQSDRRKRATHYGTDSDGKRFPLDIIMKLEPPPPIIKGPLDIIMKLEPPPPPIIKRIFGKDKLEDIPNFPTQPITDTRLLQEIRQWNVTNLDFLKRTRYYKTEDPRVKALRTIRYCEYRQRQIQHFKRIVRSRQLNQAESGVLQNLQQGYHPIFDKYLNEEFGPDAIQLVAKLEAPYFATGALSLLSTTTPPKLAPSATTPTTSTPKPTRPPATTSTLLSINIMDALGTFFPEAGRVTLPGDLLDTTSHLAKSTPIEPTSEEDTIITYYNGSDNRQGATPPITRLQELSENENSPLIPMNPFRPRIAAAPTHTMDFAVVIPSENLAFRRIFTNCTNPTWAARILLSRMDVSATRTTDGLAVTRCQPVTPDLIFKNHDVNGTCYLLTPVLVGEELWFLLPDTKDLTESSPTTPCPYSAKDQTTSSQRLFPPNMRINSVASTFLFRPPASFFRTIDSSDVAPNFQIAVLHQNQLEITNRLSKRGILTDTWMTVKNTILKARQTLTNIIISTTTELTEGVETFKRSILRIALWIIIPVVVAIVLIGCCIIYIKLYLLRRAATTASTALYEVARHFAPRNRNRMNRTVNAIGTPSPNGLEMESPLFVPRIYTIANAVNAVSPSASFIPKNTTAAAANGSIIHLITAIKLPVTIGKYTIHHQFWIAADTDCPAQLLLGSDFIRQLNKIGLPFSLDLHEHIITTGQEHHNLVQVHSVTLREETSRHVTVEGTTTLPPRTISVIRTRIHGFVPGELNEFLIEDNYRLADDLYIGRLSALRDKHKDQLRTVLRYRTDAFVGPDGHLVHYKREIRHRIDLIDNAPIPARKIYRVPLVKRHEIEKQINQMLTDGIIRESSPICAPIVLMASFSTNLTAFQEGDVTTIAGESFRIVRLSNGSLAAVPEHLELSEEQRDHLLQEAAQTGEEDKAAILVFLHDYEDLRRTVSRNLRAHEDRSVTMANVPDALALNPDGSRFLHFHTPEMQIYYVEEVLRVNVPLLYALTSKKTERAYVTIWSTLKDALNTANGAVPDRLRVVLDFERAAIKTVKRQPAADIRLRYRDFRRRNKIREKMRDCGAMMQNPNLTTVTVSRYCRRMSRFVSSKSYL